MELSVARMNGEGQVMVKDMKKALNAASMIYIFILILFPYLLCNILQCIVEFRERSNQKCSLSHNSMAVIKYMQIIYGCMCASR